MDGKGSIIITVVLVIQARVLFQLLRRAFFPWKTIKWVKKSHRLALKNLSETDLWTKNMLPFKKDSPPSCDLVVRLHVPSYWTMVLLWLAHIWISIICRFYFVSFLHYPVYIKLHWKKTWFSSLWFSPSLLWRDLDHKDTSVTAVLHSQSVRVVGENERGKLGDREGMEVVRHSLRYTSHHALRIAECGSVYRVHE